MIGLLGNHGAPKGPAASYLEKIDAIFKEQGHLAAVLGLDYRPQQSQMAESVASAPSDLITCSSKLEPVSERVWPTSFPD